jgi:hypothetical protein
MTNRNYTYFTFKEHFIREKYTFLNDFKVRQAICKIRISAHPHMIEIGRYKNLETEERLCKYIYINNNNI